MELLQLKYFCHAAETESFTATARHFSVPPSDISQSIKRLETELEVRLFDRSANRIRLNAQGRAFQNTAQTALTVLDRGVRQIRERGQRLRICVLVNRRIVMLAAEQFRRCRPDIDIELTHQEQEDFDLLITAQPPKGSWDRQELLAEDLLLAVHQADPLSARAELTAEDLRQRPFITLGKGNNLHTITERVCHDMGFTPRIAIQGDDPSYIRQCVELGLGIAIVPAISWRGQFSGAVVLKKLNVPPRNTYICSQQNPSAAAKDFSALLREMCKNETAFAFA